MECKIVNVLRRPIYCINPSASETESPESSVLQSETTHTTGRPTAPPCSVWHLLDVQQYDALELAGNLGGDFAM